MRRKTISRLISKTTLNKKDGGEAAPSIKVEGRAFPWKKNFRSIPPLLLRKIQGFNSPSIVVASLKAIKQSDIVDKLYSHLGITWDNERGLAFQDRIFPDSRVGKISRLNADGKEVVRKDLPMVSKTFTWETPNYGDTSRGYHDVSRDRDVYQREFISPKGLELTVELLEQQVVTGETVYVFKFAIDEVIESRGRDFKDDLLYALNLLQENVGKSDVFPSNATRSEYIRTVQVDWEILPPGKREEVINRILAKYRKITPEERVRIEDRYDFLTKFNPQAYVSGTSGFQRYFGAKLRDDLVVFENLRYGNAIYVMYENWGTLSKKSRIELLKGSQDDFDRIIHSQGWKGRLRKILKEKIKA